MDLDIYKKQNIYIVGYFGHSNTGDEQYLSTFNYVLKTFLPNFDTYNIIHLDCDHLKLNKFIDSDIILLGGGDVLNNYFLDQIISKFINKPNKIIAVSVGVPYTDILVNTNKLNIIDYIFVRTQQDQELFKKYFHPHRILFIPDLSYFMLHMNNEYNSVLSTKHQESDVQLSYTNNILIHNTLSKIHDSGKRIIAITLSRHIYNKNHIEEYNNILQGFSKLVKYLLTFNYHVVLLPFNTNVNCDRENDIIIHNDLYKYLSDNPNLTRNITNITTKLNPFETMSLYKYFYATVPMRFHATLFSIYTNTPMLPVFTTRKVKNLLLDINWNHGYELDRNEKDIPICINDIILINRFRILVDSHDNLSNKLLDINRNVDTTNFKRLCELISCDYSKITFSLDTNIIKSKAQDIFSKIQKIANKHNYSDFRTITDPNLQKLITQTASYYLTNGIIDSKYNYGLSSKMFNPCFNYIEEWSWVIKDYNKTELSKSHKILNNAYGLFNINYVDQVDYSGAHRSGWQYVYDNIKYLHNDSSDLYLDLYLDRTFHWNKEINKELNIIPYTHKWIGFIHHTFDTSFSDYNNYNLLNNQDFIDSLQFCKGIFVLSNTLKLQFLHEFSKRQIFVPVYNIIHPTEVHVPQFNYQQFLQNNDKKLIHIGGWLRNIFSFYNLVIPKTYKFTNSICDKISRNIPEESIRKVALKGYSMNNYYPSPDFPNQIQTLLSSLESNNNNSSNCCQNCSKNTSQNTSQNASQNSQNTSQNCSTNTLELHNNWYKHFSSHTKYMCDSVDFINKLSNDDYDQLLTENLVFINLVDASAVNTVIECIVRNTPIIVNNHPAVVELLGKNYPLYFTSTNNYFEMNKEIYELLSNTNNIKKAHYYLSNINKSTFNILKFKSTFINYIEQIKIHL